MPHGLSQVKRGHMCQGQNMVCIFIVVIHPRRRKNTTMHMDWYPSPKDVLYNPTIFDLAMAKKKRAIFTTYLPDLPVKSTVWSWTFRQFFVGTTLSTQSALAGSMWISWRRIGTTFLPRQNQPIDLVEQNSDFLLEVSGFETWLLRAIGAANCAWGHD